MTHATLLILVSAVPALADWRSHYEKGERFLQEGRASQAVSALQAALTETETAHRGVVLEALGRAESRAGNYRAAKRRLQESATLWPAGARERAVVLYNLGHVHLNMGEDARAEDVLTQALEGLGGESAVWHTLGQAQLRRNRREQAEASYRKALALADGKARPSIVSDLADLLAGKREYAKAAELWRQAIAQAAPGQARARMMANLGSLQWNWREKDQAAAQFRAALAEMESAVGTSHPDVAKILELYQEVLRKTGKKAEAVAAGERASSIRSSFAGRTNDRLETVDWRDLQRTER